MVILAVVSSSFGSEVSVRAHSFINGFVVVKDQNGKVVCNIQPGDQARVSVEKNIVLVAEYYIFNNKKTATYTVTGDGLWILK
jgi:hypothetical protein